MLMSDDLRQRVLDPLEFGKMRCRGTDEWSVGIIETREDECAGNALGRVIGESNSNVSQSSYLEVTGFN